MVRVYNNKYGRVYDFGDGSAPSPSVTTVINSFGGKNLIGWAVNECADFLEAELKSAQPFEIPHIIDDLIIMARKRHNVVRDRAGSQGTSIHKAIEARMRGHDVPELQLINPDGTPTLAAAVLDNFDKWLEGWGFEPLAIEDERGLQKKSVELKLRSLKHGYAGTADLIGETKEGKVILADLKTGKSVHKSMKLQLAAYANAFGETYDIYPDLCFVLHVLPSGHIREKLMMSKEEYNDVFPIFLDLLSVFNWYNNNGH